MARQSNHREGDSEGMRLTRYISVGQRIRSEWWHREGTQRMADLEHYWPDLACAVEALIDLVNEDVPPYPIPTDPP